MPSNNKYTMAECRVANLSKANAEYDKPAKGWQP